MSTLTNKIHTLQWSQMFAALTTLTLSSTPFLDFLPDLKYKKKYMLQWSKVFSGFITSTSCHQLPLSTFCQIVPRNSLEPRSRHLLIESESQIFWSILREIWSQSEPSRDCLDWYTEMQEAVNLEDLLMSHFPPICANSWPKRRFYADLRHFTRIVKRYE